MISKNKLKELAAYRLQKRCDEQQVYVVEGCKMAAEAMSAKVKIRIICASSAWLNQHAPLPTSIEVYEASPSDMERLSHQKCPSEVWMLVERPSTPDIQAITGRLTLALDRIQDPGNMGTMLRTADWFGVRHVVCSSDTVSCFNPKVVQASMGAIFRTAVHYTDLPRWLAACRKPIYGASLQGRPLPEIQFDAGSSVLLIGNEGRGISAEAMSKVTHPVLIPNIGGTAESLNAAVASGILMALMSI